MTVGKPLIRLSGAVPLLHRATLLPGSKVLAADGKTLVVVGAQLSLVVLPLLVVHGLVARADLNPSAVSAAAKVRWRDFQAESVAADDPAIGPVPVLVGAAVAYPLDHVAAVPLRLEVTLFQGQAAAIFEDNRAFFGTLWPQREKQNARKQQRPKDPRSRKELSPRDGQRDSRLRRTCCFCALGGWAERLWVGSAQIAGRLKSRVAGPAV